MAINTSFARPKLAQTLTENLALSGAIAEGSGKFLVDINVSITQDDTDVVVKTLFRQEITWTISGTTMTINGTFHAFQGNATDYSSGGTTPPLSSATATNQVDLDAFFTAAGDARKNS